MKKTLLAVLVLAVLSSFAFAQSLFSVGVGVHELSQPTVVVEGSTVVFDTLRVGALASVPVNSLAGLNLVGTELLAGVGYDFDVFRFPVEQSAEFVPYTTLRLGVGDLFTGGNAYWVGHAVVGLVGYEVGASGTMVLEGGVRATFTDLSFDDFDFAPVLRFAFGVSF